jgi:ligand-binding sensor domain-containing protein/serine phosphatase RsbU (regulator of sigma subunit)
MKYKNYILFFIISIITFFNGYVFAQGQIINAELFTIEDGLSQTSIHSVLQDSKGFLWIGTQDGLNKYDGYSFKTFKNEPNDTTSISNNYIHCLFEDSQGDIWVGTNLGLNKYDRYTNTFTHYLADPTDPDKLKENEIYAIYEDSKGILWIKTINYLTRINPKTLKFRHYNHYNDVFNFVSVNTKFTILEDEEGVLWVGTKDGLNFFDQKLEIFKRYAHDPSNDKSLSDNRVKMIYLDSKGTFWVGTENGLNKFDRKREVFIRYYNNPTNPNSLLNSNINVVFEDKSGGLWIGTDNGLNKYNSAIDGFESFTALTYQNQNKLITSITSIIQDKSDIIWIGSLQGLIKMEQRKQSFRLYDNGKDNTPLFSNNYVSAILKDNNRRIWVGTWGTGLHVFNRKSNQIEKFNAANSNLKNDYVHKIFQDKSGRIWIGTQNGIYFYNESSNSFYTFENKRLVNTFRTNRVYDILQDSKDNVWVACRNGLHKITGDSIKSYYSNLNDKNTISSNLVYCLIEDKNGIIWIGCEFGFNRLDPKTETIKQYIRSNYSCDNCLSSNEIITVFEDKSNDCLWIGTVNGLNKFIPEGETFITYTEKDGLPNNIIYAILQDNSGNLWMSTNRGISKFDPVKEEFYNFGISDGLQNYEFNIGAYYRSGDDEMFFGGISGLNSFYPDSVKKKQFIPNVEITSVELLSDEKNRLVTIGRDKTINVPYDNNLITIEFSALDFSMSEKNNYAYKLEGIEDEWISLGNRRYVNFSNLPSGKYIFRVKGSNSDFVWNEDGADLQIIVETPIWKHPISYTLYIILAIFSVFSLIQYRTRNLRKTNYELKEKELIAEQIAVQKEELTLKNKNITDSIIYAKRIQEALMPSMNLFSRLLPDSFLLHKAKDIVSGDFYWVNEKNNKTFLAIVDCTGHGVPGAFMSIIGFELLRKITDDQGIENADQILHELNKGIELTFGKDSSNIRLKDGMDIAMCMVDKEKNELEFAGAFRPMYFVRDNKIEEIRGDRFSVGLLNEGEGIEITKTTVKLQKNDIFYFFSDGYADQFGGPEGKKFKYRRFRHLLLTIHKLPLDQQKVILEKSFDEWRGNFEQVDDVLIVGLKPGLGQ